MTKLHNDTKKQNWEDSWIEESQKLFRKRAMTQEEPYFKRDSGTYKSKPIFFGATIVYFFVRLISVLISIVRFIIGDPIPYPSNQKRVSQLAKNDVSMIQSAANKIAAVSPIKKVEQPKVAEQPKEKFEDEGVVYRP